MAKLPTIEGCLTALVTPFRDGKVDFDGLAKLVDWQIEQGVDGIVVRRHDRRIGDARCRRARRGDRGDGQGRARAACRWSPAPAATRRARRSTLTKASEDAGADALLHVTPYYNRPNQEGLFRHFEAIAKATKLPIILYNVPTRTACDLLTDTVVRLADFDNIIGIKDATGNLVRGSELIAKVGDRIADAVGRRRHRVPALRVRRARRDLGGVERRAARDERHVGRRRRRATGTRAKQRHFKLRVLNQLLFAEPSPAPTKAALSLLGRCSTRRAAAARARDAQARRAAARPRCVARGCCDARASACSARRAGWGAR